MNHAFPVGIDLGTTNSAVAYITEAGHTAMVPDELEHLTTPSYVYFDDENVIIGREAKKARSYAADRVVACAKRDVGETYVHDRVEGRNLPPEAVQAYVLRALKRDIEREIGSAYETVITVPAFFDELRRSKTLDTGRIAGLPVLDIVNEPTAAALAFGEQLGYLTDAGVPREDLNLLVYDLGGGTFDVTVIRLLVGEVQTLATDGDFRLGGHDWDQRLVEYVAQKFEDQHRIDPREDDLALSKLHQMCEETKHTLTARRRTVVTADHQGCRSDVTVTRETFQELTEDLLERTVVTARHAIESAELTWEQIDRILLVGGSTRMPMVAQRLREVTGITPDEAVNPDEAVARGAAIYASHRMHQKGGQGSTLRLNVIDVNSHSLGTEGIDQSTERRQNTILIPRNTPLPAIVTYKFVTKETDQRSVVVKVLEGETQSALDCVTIGKAILRDLPPNLPKGYPIEVTFSCQANGQLEVSARVTGTQHSVTVHFQRDGSMHTGHVRKWQQALASDAGYQTLEPLLDQLYGAPGAEPPIVELPDESSSGDADAQTSRGGHHMPAGGDEPDVSSAEQVATAPPFQPTEANNLAESSDRSRERRIRSRGIGVLGYAAAILVGIIVGLFILAVIIRFGPFAPT